MNKRSDTSKKAISNKLKIIIATLSIFVIAGGIFLVTVVQDKKMVKKADSLVAIGKYENGIAMYDHLLTEKYSDDVMEKRERAIDLMEADENYKHGVEALENDDRYKAIKYFSKVPEGDRKLFDKASDELADIEEVESLEIQEWIDQKDFANAYKQVNAYLKAEPSSSKIKELKETLIATEKDVKKQNALAKENEEKKVALAKEEEEKVAKAREEERKNQEAKAITVAKNNEMAQLGKDRAIRNANDIMWTSQVIVTDKGNLRAAPTLKGSLITALPRGTEVYVIDTQVESADRIWCKVEVIGTYYTGWISYNTMNYTLP